MHFILIFQLLVLLVVANAMPVIVKKLLGDFLHYPLDAGIALSDKQPLFGSSKTIRGVILSVIATTMVAPAIGFQFRIGLVVGSFAMLGDLASSFVKRRLKLPVSSRATGLDQIPESLLPTLACSAMLDLSILDFCLIVSIFFVSEIALSRLLFKWHVRDRPF